MLKYSITILLVVFSFSSKAQSWLDVFNRYRVAQAADWLAPTKIPRSDLRPFVTLARRQQACSDCRVDTLGDAGRFALAMQGQGTRKSIEGIKNNKGETLLTARDTDFLRAHAWDGAGKVFIGSTLTSPIVQPQSLVMALVSQIGVRGHPLVVGFKGDESDTLIWGYRLLPISPSDVKDASVRDGVMYYPVVLRFNIYIYEPVDDPSFSLYDFNAGRDNTYAQKTRVGQNTSAITIKAEFTFDQPVHVSQNGYQAQGNGRLVDSGRWVDDNKIDHLWVASPYGSTSSEHPALSPKALNLIEEGKWNSPDLTKRLTTMVKLKNSHIVFPWLDSIDFKNYPESKDGIKKLISKKIEHAFYRKKIPIKVWSESIYIPDNNEDPMILRMTFYGNYDQAKVITLLEAMNFKIHFNEAY